MFCFNVWSTPDKIAFQGQSSGMYSKQCPIGAASGRESFVRHSAGKTRPAITPAIRPTSIAISNHTFFINSVSFPRYLKLFWCIFFTVSPPQPVSFPTTPLEGLLRKSLPQPIEAGLPISRFTGAIGAIGQVSFHFNLRLLLQFIIQVRVDKIQKFSAVHLSFSPPFFAFGSHTKTFRSSWVVSQPVARDSRSLFRARCSRILTVDRGMSNASAISRFLRPCKSCSTSAA